MSNISSEPALDWVQLVQFLPSRFADSLWRRDAIVENVGVLVSSRVAFKDNVKRLWIELKSCLSRICLWSRHRSSLR